MSPARQLLYWLGALAFLFVAFYLLSSILLPFVAGMAIAYFFDPAADKLEKWGCSRTVATCIITLLIVVLAFAVILLLFPLLQNQIVELISSLPAIGQFLWEQIQALLAIAQTKLPPEYAERLRTVIGEYVGGAVGSIGSVVARIVSGGLALFNLLSLIFITPIVAFYLLRDWDYMRVKVDDWLPRQHAATIRDLLRQIDRTISGFVRGQAMVCLILGAFYAIALSIAGLKFGLIVGLSAGLISFVPYLGAVSGFLIAIALAVSQFSEWIDIAIVAAIFIVGQAIEGNVLQPKLVGDRVGLHAVWIIFALLAGGALLGFVGLLLAIPLAAAIGVLIRFALSRYLASPLYRGCEGPPDPDAEP
jgi:predicted PurR-regulated permease PerM